jgi:TonB family protein
MRPHLASLFFFSVPSFVLVACAPGPVTPSSASSQAPGESSDPSAPADAPTELPPCPLAMADEQDVASFEPPSRVCPFETHAASPAPASSSDAGDAAAPADGSLVIGFRGNHMEKPQLLCRPRIVYTKQAYENHVHGLALTKCVIDLDGTLCNCRITHSVPYMDEAILAATSTWKYTPVRYKGHPQRVEIIIPIKLAAVRPSK